MPSSGSGIAIPIPNVVSPSAGHPNAPILPGSFVLGLTLDRYQELMRLPIAAFNGLNNPNETPVYECSTIWKQSERNALMLALAQAEEMREQELSYHISPKYDVLENLEYANPLILPRKHLVKLGLLTISDIELAVAISYGTDPNFNDPVILSIATTVTDPGEIAVFYDGEDYTLSPSSVSISGGVATIKIPRSRLVKPELLDDRDDHLYYNDNDNFVPSVDIKRVYLDTTNTAQYVWNYSCDANTIEETTQAAYTRITDNRLAIVQHRPATYASGVWTRNAFTICRVPDSMTVYALSGRQSSVYTEMATIRLAHTLMPNTPCSCPYVKQYWEGDREDSDIVTPYGRSKGALDAWSMDSRAKVGQGGKFPSMRVRF